MGLLITPSLAFTGTVSLGNVLPTADIAQFKQGVKSVAGKMAVLANGVMNSLQVRLGCWAGKRCKCHARRFAFCSPDPAEQPRQLERALAFLGRAIFHLCVWTEPLPKVIWPSLLLLFVFPPRFCENWQDFPFH